MQPGAQTQQREVMVRDVEQVDACHVACHVAFGCGSGILGVGQVDHPEPVGLGSGTAHHALAWHAFPRDEFRVETVAARDRPTERGGE